MKSTFLTALGIASVLAAFAAAPEVSAACNPTKDFRLAYSEEGDYWLNFPPGTNTTIGGGVIKTRFWQAGDRAIANEGVDCPQEAYLVQSDPNHITFFGQSGGQVLNAFCVNEGCVTGAQITLIQTLSNDGTKAYYAVGKVTETVGEFRYNRGGTDWQVTEVPRPRVQQISRAGATLVLNVCLDPPAGAHGEADGFPRNSILTGYQIVHSEGFGDPGRLPQAWTNIGAVQPVNENGCTTVIFQTNACITTTGDVFIAMRPVFDGGQFLGDYVGASTRLVCSPLAADPRFNRIDRTKSGRDATRTNPPR